MAGRYRDCPVATLTLSDGREVAYLLPRTPGPARPPLARHRVAPDDRADLISATYLGDPTAFWAVCDANHVLDPDELTAPDRHGSVIEIPGA